MSNPLFSFLLITYKQEQFVEEAFRSCINQTFRDFEIIISDDNSPDGTFDVLQKLVEEYLQMGGGINIILHRNEHNKGIGGNFQQAAALSHGKWLVMAAGDDVSLPNRLETLKHVVESYPEAYGINTARYFVDEKTENPQYNFKEDYLLGADSVWHRSLFFDFQPLDKRVMSEDHILNLRAMLKGEMLQVNTPTIKYRISSQNYSMQKTSDITEKKRADLKKMNYHRELLLFRIEDLERWKAKDNNVLSGVEEKILRELKEINSQIASFEKFISVAEGNISSKINYLLSSSNFWLHNRFVYRFYNLLKMYHLISEKPKRKTDWCGIETRPDNRVIRLTLKDYVERESIF